MQWSLSQPFPYKKYVTHFQYFFTNIMYIVAYTKIIFYFHPFCIHFHIATQNVILMFFLHPNHLPAYENVKRWTHKSLPETYNL